MTRLRIPHHTARAVGVAGVAALLLVTGCSKSNDSALKDTAVQYLLAVENGDAARQCDLSVAGQGSGRDHCLKTAQPGHNGYTAEPRADRVVKWNDEGYAVAVEVHLKANPDPKWNSLGMVKSGDTWLVDKFGWIEGDPSDDANVTAALT